MTDTPRRDEWTPPADPFVDRPATRAAPIDTDDSYHRFQAEDRSLGEIASAAANVAPIADARALRRAGSRRVRRNARGHVP